MNSQGTYESESCELLMAVTRTHTQHEHNRTILCYLQYLFTNSNNNNNNNYYYYYYYKKNKKYKKRREKRHAIPYKFLLKCVIFVLAIKYKQIFWAAYHPTDK